MKRILLAVALLATATANAGQTTTVTMLQFSDYHSHALPFYSEGRADQGGIARAVAYLRREKQRGALIFSGGDMINKDSPAWSDKYGCSEWPWLNGIVDAMAFGNHDADYGSEAFERCRAATRYPILSANVTREGGRPFRGYVVLRHGKLRIGVFALAGPDFPTLVKSPGFRFGNAVDAAREVVGILHDKEHVDAVVLIGHESIDDDFALAKAVPGIDVIFGSHSHLRRDLTTIEGTKTVYISPFQYLTYVSRLELVFEGRRLATVRGGVVPVDATMPTDPAIAKRVATMQHDLERDPQYAALFETIGVAAAPISADGQLTEDSALGDLVMDVVRDAAKADVAISTSSSFRQSIDAGPITMEELRAALPYDNGIVVYELTGAQLDKLVAYSLSRRDTDFFSQVSGIRIGTPFEATKRYRVATTEYLAKVAPGYRELFAGLTGTATGLRIRDEVRKFIAAHSPVTATRDGRLQR